MNLFKQNKLLSIWLIVLTILGIYNCFHCKVDLRLNITTSKGTAITSLTKTTLAN